MKIQCAADAVKAINEEIIEARRKSGILEETKKYKLWVVEESPRFERVKSSKGLMIKGIRQIHSLSLSPQGILAQKVSCTDCHLNELCSKCKSLKLTFSRAKILEVMEEDPTSDDEQDGVES